MTPAQCPGTRQPVLNRRRPKPTPYTGTYADRYGRGLCRVCGKLVTCHKDGSAVYHAMRRDD